MFVREKVARGHRYLYLLESIREGSWVRQQIVRALGRKDALLESGELDRLIASLARPTCSCTIFTAPWHGWGRRRLPLPWARWLPDASRILSKSGCSSGGGICWANPA